MIKDSLFIDSRLPVNFWAEAIDTSNYLRNRLSTRQNGLAFIQEKAWTGIRQDLEHVRIFGSRVSTFIPTEKCTKSDIRKTIKGYPHWLYRNLQIPKSLDTLYASSFDSK